MRVIDLSVVINENTPVYPGDPKTKVEPAGTFSADSYMDHVISLGTHVGTHIDAPLHMLEDGKSLDQIPIEQFVGRGRLIKISKFDLTQVQAADLAEGDIVLFATGMSAKYHEPIYFEQYPVMTEEIADYLVSKKVKMVGLDTGNVDIEADFPIHKKLLSGGVLIIENLTNLQALDGQNFTVYALPLKLDVDGAPARVVAVIE